MAQLTTGGDDRSPTARRGTVYRAGVPHRADNGHQDRADNVQQVGTRNQAGNLHQAGPSHRAGNLYRAGSSPPPAPAPTPAPARTAAPVPARASASAPVYPPAPAPGARDEGATGPVPVRRLAVWGLALTVLLVAAVAAPTLWRHRNGPLDQFAAPTADSPKVSPPLAPPASAPLSEATRRQAESTAAAPAGGQVLSSWALWSSTSKTVVGSDNRNSWTNSTESMVKPWIVADFLRRHGPGRPAEQDLRDAVDAIVRSDDQAAQRLYRKGGGDAVIHRMIDICGLRNTSIGKAGWWSYTYLTATDAVRLGRCLADGRAAGGEWTPWLLDQMRRVDGDVTEEPYGGRWGIIDALPQRQRDRVAIKNGWTLINQDGMWHLNCLAVTDRWTLAVLTRYPAELGKRHGATICRDRAAALLRADRLPAP